MSWELLARMGLIVRPFDGSKPPLGGGYCRFDTPLRKTFLLLTREMGFLDAHDIVVELDVRDRDIRLDGYPRADARPAGPAIAISFESKHGPLRYATAEFGTWQDNLRAIALSMEALRAVDRYGVSKRGEQYRGWRAIAAASADPADLIQSKEQAWEALCREAGVDVDVSPIKDGIGMSDVVNRALRSAHPDTGGSDERFRLVQRAREVLAG